MVIRTFSHSHFRIGRECSGCYYRIAHHAYLVFHASSHVQGYKKYVTEAVKAVQPHYSRTHFYDRCKELLLRDRKGGAGFCPNCTQLNIFPRLKEVPCAPPPMLRDKRVLVVATPQVSSYLRNAKLLVLRYF